MKIDLDIVMMYQKAIITNHIINTEFNKEYNKTHIRYNI